MRTTVTLRRWDRHEITEVRKQARGGIPAHKIAKSLKRTESAVRQKAAAEGISLRMH